MQSEGEQLELTKSLLNILYNIVTVRSIDPHPGERPVFENNADLIWYLVRPSVEVKNKKPLLLANIPLVLAIAKSCPPS